MFTGAGPGAYRVVTAGPDGTPVRTSSGLTLVPDLDLSAAPPPDTVVVPGGEGTRSNDPAVVDWLRRHAPRTRRVASVCSGAFLLAEAGLLAGRRATTHWRMCASLARRYQDVEVDPQPISSATGRSPPRRASRPASTWRWRWSRRTSGGRSRWRSPGIW
ncbi:DJ-1/PfpI family protein [Paractinoplanes ferrugineus]|uniref:DJ-1/PfpI family protein n=1 Tax=Paractinoplanes ferrugineus TaxID=113564 RepID=UPI0034DB3C61